MKLWNGMRVTMFYFVCLALAFQVLTSSAEACAQWPGWREEVKNAHVVVVGRIANYTIILDPKHPNRPSNRRSDYAKFDILVDEVLVGQAAKTIAVTWHSYFAAPEDLSAGTYLIALRSSENHFKVKVAFCGPAFLFPSDSEEAQAVRQIL